MQPGERLPSERSLALEFRVGRPSVREAIKALQILDVLDSRQGDGTFIKSRAGLSGGWPSQVDLDARNIDLIELLEVRKMIEPNAASLSAARRNEKQLAAMEAEVVAQEKRPDDRENLIRHDYLFHGHPAGRGKSGARGRGPISRPAPTSEPPADRPERSESAHFDPAAPHHSGGNSSTRSRHSGAGHAHSFADRWARFDCSEAIAKAELSRESRKYQHLRQLRFLPKAAVQRGSMVLRSNTDATDIFSKVRACGGPFQPEPLPRLGSFFAEHPGR